MPDSIAVIVAAVIAGVFAIAAAIIGAYNQRKLNEIHVVMNSRLDEALAEIESLKVERDKKV